MQGKIKLNGIQLNSSIFKYLNDYSTISLDIWEHRKVMLLKPDHIQQF